jgi:hypothetical protein
MNVERLRVAVVVVAVLRLAPSLAWSQDSNSATIAGVVRDASGAVLPGVTVEAASPALIEKVRAAATDSDGRFRIIELRPGEYTVTFTLPGFRTLRRDGLQLTTGFTATVNGDLSVGGLEETITVTGAAPIVDVQGVQEQQVFSGDTMRALPIGKNSGIYVTLIPAATQGNLANQDVGGTKGESTQNFSVHGGRANETSQFRDGLYFGEHVSNAANWAASANRATVQEVAVQATGGLTAEAQNGGVIINTISRDGGNEYHGTFSSDFGHRNLQTDNINDELRARGATLTGTIRQLYDVGFGIGGPLKRDRLWFYASGRKYSSSSNWAGNYYNKSANPMFYEADLSRPAYDHNINQETSLRMTWQVTPKQKFTGSGRYEYNCYCNLVSGGGISPEAAGSNWYVPLVSGQGSWTYPATNRLLFQAGGVMLGGHHRRKQAEEVVAGPVAIFDRLSNYWYGSADRTVVTSFQNLAQTERGQGNVGGSMSYVTGSHNFKVGGVLLQSYRDVYQPLPAGISYTFAGTVPESVTLIASPLNLKMRTRQLGLYAQEQWTLDRLTLYGGLRFDHDRGWNPAQDVPAGRYIGARHYDKVDNVPNWKDINPRAGVAFDLFGNGRTAVKANLGRFVAFEANGGINFSSNPANAIATNATRVWTDANRDYVPQDSELGPLSNANFGRPIQTTRFAENVLHGWGNRGYNWQGAVTVQHELVTGLGVNLGYYRTSYGNFYVTDNTLLSPSDFDSYCIVTPNDSRLPNPSERICGLLDVKPAKFGQVSNIVNLDKAYGGQSEAYDGIDLTLNARLRGGVIGGGFATGRTTTDACDIVDDVPEFAINLAANGLLTSNHTTGSNSAPSRFCSIQTPWSSLTQIKLFGTYQLPWDLRASANFQHLPGLATTARYTVSGADMAAGLGRAPAAGARATAVVELIEPQSLHREKSLNQLSLAVTRIVSFGTYRVQPTIELHNALNASTVNAINAAYGPAWQTVRGVLAPRIVKFAVHVDF